jgi:hypothetical protein
VASASCSGPGVPAVCRRLPEIEHLRRPAQNYPGITQVSREVIGRALRGALEQRLCVQGFLIRR